MCAMFLLLKKSSDRRQLEAIERAFKEADSNGDGFLTPEDYMRIAKEQGMDLSREEALQIMSVADKDKDGLVSKEEFIANACGSPLGGGSRRGSMKNLHKMGDDEKADLAFKLFDKNHDGFITKKDMLETSKNLTKQQVDAVFEKNDGDGDGRMTREEFHGFMQHAKTRQNQQNK